MKVKYYIVFLALMLMQVLGNHMFAQKCLAFRYDADGNRIKKTLSNNCDNQRDADLVQELVPVDELTIYPNPTNGIVRIVLPLNKNREAAFYKFYDMNGMLLMENRLHDRETVIDIENQPSGVYLLKITSGDEEISRVILKQ